MSTTRQGRLCKVFDYLVFRGKVKTRQEFAEAVGINKTNLSSAMNGNEKYLSDSLFIKVNSVYNNINLQWLLTGEGEMLSGNMANIKYEPSATPIEQEAAECYVPMLPLQAIGGALTGFDDSATLDKCERVLSPIAGIDFAMEVYGDSMTPDYPSGARIFVKKIDMSAFIEWGRVYVLDTVNGSIVKEVYPAGDTAVECRSVNPQYPPFVVQLKDVRGMYRVLMSMQMK